MARPKMTLEKRQQLDERAERILTGALRGRGGSITKADAVALTGLPADDAEGALRTLLSRYRSHLAVTEQGELVYRFDPKMERRDAVTLGERLRQLGDLAWKTFTFLFKIWIVATLVIYTALFLLMLLGLALARSSDRDDDREGGFGISPWLLWWLLPDFGRSYGGHDPYGDPRRRRLAGRKRPDKRFYQSVFDYVFGPRQPAADPLAADKEVVAFLRAADGRISATDLVALTGWSYERADEEVTRLLVDYDGSPDIQEDGTLLYVFPSLRRTAGEVEAGSWRYQWDKRPSLPPLTGNTSGTNTAITVMNGFNLVAAFTISPVFIQRFGLDPALSTWLTAFPAAFSAVFYSVPGLRALQRSRREKRLLDEAARAAVLAEILALHGSPAAPDALVAAAQRRGNLEPARLHQALEKLLVELEGDVVNAEEGTIQYRFPRIAAELQAVEAARRLAPAAERDIGQVVFSSDAEGTGEALEAPVEQAPKQLN